MQSAGKKLQTDLYTYENRDLTFQSRLPLFLLLNLSIYSTFRIKWNGGNRVYLLANAEDSLDIWGKAFGAEKGENTYVNEATLLHEYLSQILKRWEEVAASNNKRKSTFFDMLTVSSDRHFKGLSFSFSSLSSFSFSFSFSCLSSFSHPYFLSFLFSLSNRIFFP